ncbi:MAG TPA: hypothetical protein VGO11_02410 [Chthoniobacteraceae bacterium]|jgi:Flp pilus assembly secretin CpaC|nr:hypothetical protein [Chthoniobacteraceae bacterium]
MKRVLPLVFLFSLARLASAQEPAPAEKKPREPVADVTVELRCVTMTQEVAVPLIRKFRSAKPEEKSAAAAEVDALLAKGTAKLVGWPMITTHSGAKARDEAVQEFYYATRFDAGQNALFVSDGGGQLRQEPPPTIKADHEPLPAAFESKEIGVKMEVEPLVDEDGKKVSVTLDAEHTRLQSVDKITVVREQVTEKKTEKVTVEQPRISTMKVQTDLTMENGEQRLVGIFKVTGEGNELELFVLGVEIHEKK